MAGLNKVVVELFYDIISPYSWIAFEALTRYHKNFPSMDLHLKPVFIGAIMASTGNKPPATLPAKGKYMTLDLPTIADYYNLPFKFPKDVGSVMFKKGSLITQRLLTAVQQNCPEYLEDLTRELYLRVWSKDLDIVDLSSLREACEKVGMDDNLTESILARTKDEELKQSLKNTTQTALDYGAFGLPTYVAHLSSGPRMFFGCDKLYLLCHCLNLPYPGPLNEIRSAKL